MSVKSVTFSKQPFWIEVWGLPFDLINKETGSDICRSIGELVEVAYKAFNSDQSKFLRIRVKVPLDKSIRRGGSVISSEGVAFRYERLVSRCFNCGRIGHDQKDCMLPVNAENRDRPYGEWLKAGIRGRPNEMDGG